MRTLYTLAGFGLFMSALFFCICVSFADSSTTMTASITVVDAISLTNDGDAVPVQTNDGTINYNRR